MSTGVRCYTTARSGWKICIKDPDPGNHIKTLIDNYLFSPRQAGEWARMGSSVSSEVWQGGDGENTCILKWYLRRSIFEYLKAAFQGSRARRAWAGGVMLIQKDIPTPELLAWGEKSLLGIPIENFLATRSASEASGLYTFLTGNFRTFPLTSGEILRKRSLIVSIGKLVGRMHSKGIVHGDLRPENILVGQLSPSGWEFALIDNERNRTYARGIPDSMRIKNLVQVNMFIIPQVTFTDRLRFLLAYLEENPLFKPDWKNWARAVHIRTRSRLQEKHPGLWEKGERGKR